VFIKKKKMFKPTNIATPEEIFAACQKMQPFLEAYYEADNGAACVDRLQQCESYMALSGKLLADAKHRLRELEESSILQAVIEGQKKRMATSTINKYIDSLTRDYAYLVDWCDRINRSATHSADFQRTIISKLKEEMRLSGYGHPG
jgi:hypothetical protein